MKDGFLMLAAGLLNGLLGTGGGIAAMPVLYAIYRAPKEAHRWVSLLIFPLTVLSLISQKFLPDRFAFPLSVGALFGGLTGAILLDKVSGDTLRLIFSVLLFYTGVRCFF